MERPLIADPNDHEAKPIAGALDARGLVTIVAVMLACSPFVLAMFVWHFDSTIGTLLAMLVGAPIGYVGMASYKNLKFEQFAPLMWRERMRPTEMCHEMPQPVLGEPEEKPVKRSKKEIQAEEDERTAALLLDHAWAEKLYQEGR